MLDHVLAKYKKDKNSGKVESETLVEHTENVLRSLLKLQERYPELPETFWESAFIMCLFHDAGKISDNFQRMLSGHKYENVRHELLSGAFCLYFCKSFLKQESQFAAAIYSHHKHLNSELFDNHQFKKLELNYELIKAWFEYVAFKLKEKDTIQAQIREGTLQKLSVFNPDDYKSRVFQPFYDLNKQLWNEKSRLEYINAKAVLNISDWSASGHFNLSKSFLFDETLLLDALQEKLEKEGKKIDKLSFRKFQLESKKNSNVLAIAPTGSGKTEASLIWASQKNEYDKIIYCLPTRVTSNAIYKRLAGYFGNQNCSVVHSSALLYQKEIDNNYDTRKYLRDRTFFSNITVCTIDQLLTQGFNLGFWEIKSFHCRNASIIIDEIHLYSPYTLALILQTIKFLREKLNARFFIMSATMPSKLRSLLNEALGGKSNYSLIQDAELLQSSRNLFEIRKITIQENIHEIKIALRNYLKVLVVVNTVDQAIELYQQLKPMAEKINKNCICFHSRFIQKDRKNIESQISYIEDKGEPVLLIATQVVEVSLDIDFDILFTENAPVDAIVQRAGRINRIRNSKKDSKVIVHQHSKVSEEFVYTETDILDKTFRVLSEHHYSKITEGEFLNLVDEVYKDIDVTQRLSFKDGWKAYYNVQSTYYFLGDCPSNSEEAMTRDGLDTVSVIPFQFYEELQTKKLQKHEKVKFELSINRKRYMAAKAPSDSDGFKYVNYTYFNDVGLVFNNQNGNNSTIII
ncbi:CRISPR-associated helicase, Cas3 family [Tangfeifania diversioriginum]|uniref:CRISPR-associated helicase, Cas3 family n=1 Tax=Tangfeifania diversioriginum TaxID=1168035 RepID=A0A1M6IBD8_9BACT|nr:CRISPR-associated helicase/endonuclease Cas3 [Tangfeifania diversioriginum]SHJ31723.1 CRISPR-associated helicase, Cas3 family [Tangfeifania diversioriginum]